MREGWEYKKFTDVCDIQYGYAFDSKCFTDDENAMPLIRIRDVVRGYSETFYNGDIPSGYTVNEGDYLVGMDGEFNIGRWGKRPGLLNQRVCKMASSSILLDNQYMYYFMKICLKSIEDETPFVTVKHLSAKRINKIQIPLPPLPLQKSIVAELDEINNLLSLKRKELETYDKLAQSLFYEMFGDPVENEKGWVVSTIGEVCAIKSGDSKANNAKEGSIAYIKVSDMNLSRNRDFITTSNRFVDYEFVKKNIFPIGTIIFPKRGESIRTNKKRLTKIQVCCDLNLMGVYSSDDRLDKMYLYYYFQKLDFRKIVKESSTIPQINNGEISPLKIQLPPLSLQRLFAERIEAIEAQKVQVKAAIEKLERLLAARMQYWFD